MLSQYVEQRRKEVHAGIPPPLFERTSRISSAGGWGGGGGGGGKGGSGALGGARGRETVSAGASCYLPVCGKALIAAGRQVAQSHRRARCPPIPAICCRITFLINHTAAAFFPLLSHPLQPGKRKEGGGGRRSRSSSCPGCGLADSLRSFVQSNEWCGGDKRESVAL